MILCIDTITPKANVDLLKGGKSLGGLSFDPYQASEKTLLSVDELLRANNASVQQLTGVALVNGPGSFTGLRVGLAIGNTFVQELNLNSLSLTTDEWWKHGIEEADWVYVQSMNRSEVYGVGFGEYKGQFNGLVNVEELPQNIVWSGIVSDLHRDYLSAATELSLADVGEVWLKAVEENVDGFKKGVLIEAFYLKKPNITVAKNLNPNL